MPILKRAGVFEVTSGRVLSFPDVSVGETAAPSHSASSSWPRGLSRRMRRGQACPPSRAAQARPPAEQREADGRGGRESLADRSLKRPTRELWN
jgi:hypothetical protein